MAATLKVHKRDTQNVYVKLVKALHELFQALLSASMSNWTVNSLESIAKVPHQQVAKLGK